MQDKHVNWSILYNDIDRVLRITVDISPDTTTTAHQIGFQLPDTTYSIVGTIAYPDNRVSIPYAPGNYSIRRLANPSFETPWMPPKLIDLDTIFFVYGDVRELDGLAEYPNSMSDIKIYLILDRANQMLGHVPDFLFTVPDPIYPDHNGQFMLKVLRDVYFRIWIPVCEFNRVYRYTGDQEYISLSELVGYEI